MLEVHLGSKPGRPTLLLILCAAALLGSLGLAYLQVSDARALGPAQRIAGTPLVVRPPRGWAPSAESPRVFVPSAESGEGASPSPFGWRVRFGYERHEAFVSPQRIVERFVQGSPIRPATLGGMPAVEVRGSRLVRFGKTTYRRETALRVASSMRGDVVLVEYWPPARFTAADGELLDEICAAVRFNDARATVPDADAAKHAGVAFPLAKEWSLLGASHEQTPGCYVLASVDGSAMWGLGIFRTWLVNGRTPTDLLYDCAQRLWDLDADQVSIEQWKRPDGARVTSMSAKRPVSEAEIASFLAIAPSNEEAVLVGVFGLDSESAVAKDAARALADALTLLPTDRLPNVRQAQQDGRTLAAELGALAKQQWGGALVENFYLGALTPIFQPSQTLALALLDTHAPFSGGFRGSNGFLTGIGSFGVESWLLNGDGVGYESNLHLRYRSAGGTRVQTVREIRARSGKELTRTFGRGPKARVTRIKIGSAFVPPPLESLAEQTVAARDKGAWLIEISMRTGVATHTRLLRPIAPDAQKRRRVMLMEDFWPRGDVITFEKDGQRAEVNWPGGVAQRISKKDADANPLFGDLRKILPD